MPIYKTEKVLEYNKDNFHASHINSCRLSITEIFPLNITKKEKEDHIYLTVTTINEKKEENSAFISLDRIQMKEIIKVFTEILNKQKN